jgi:hypothetical protein
MDIEQQIKLEQIKLINMCPNTKIDISAIDDKQLIDFVSNKNYMNGQYLKSLVCLFNTFLDYSKNLELPISKFDFIKDIKKVEIKSVNSSVYTVDILSKDFQIIIKTPQKINIKKLKKDLKETHKRKFSKEELREEFIKQFNDIMKDKIKELYREYYISIAGINNLRYKIPTFVYTFGIFKPHTYQIKNLKLDEIDENIFIMNEQIIGESMYKFIKDKNISVTEWLDIFIQLLISLEVGQRDIKFTHFDLHLGNILITKDKVIPYELNFDNYTYSINNTQYKPVIIDFGMSSITINGIQSGYEEEYSLYRNYGITPFMVSGRDMHKILCACFNFNKEIDDVIRNIYTNFYEIRDVDLFFEEENGNYGKKIDDKYAKSGTTNNKISSKTPLMLINWLLTNYNQNITTLTKKERSNYINLEYCNYVEKYDTFFSIEEKISDNIEHIKTCISKSKSFILFSYNIKLLIEINNNLNNYELGETISKLQSFLIKRKEKYITNDLKMLNKCFDIKLPSKNDLDYFPIVITIDFKRKRDVDIFRKDFLLEYKFIIDVEPYIDIYYTILETKIYDEYKQWIDTFIKSDIWMYYKDYIDRYHMIDRYTTLQSNILGYLEIKKLEIKK